MARGWKKRTSQRRPSGESTGWGPRMPKGSELRAIRRESRGARKASTAADLDERFTLATNSFYRKNGERPTEFQHGAIVKRAKQTRGLREIPCRVRVQGDSGFWRNGSLFFCEGGMIRWATLHSLGERFLREPC